MIRTKQLVIDILAAAITSTWLLCSAGCSGAASRTYPVKGQIEAAGMELKILVGHTIEVAQDANPEIRAAGQIQEDGTFSLETVYGSEILAGAREGIYKARIVLADDDPAVRNLAGRIIHPKHFAFEKSGLSISVPAAAVVSLRVTRR